MERIKALYGRQSIDKKDSISIETQLKYGKNICELNNWTCKEYYDKGYSGSNMDRPDFKKLLRDIKDNKIDTVICYRLDRISRSLVDFANLLEIFRKHDVEFISATENFDTSTPIGRAMINIIMVFAQLERETIQQRITDNYYERAKRAAFVGGGIPLGYTNIKKMVNGKMTSILIHDADKIKTVKKIYEDYKNNKAIRSIASDLTQEQDKLVTDKYIKRILTNPIYAKCDANMYHFFKSKGYLIHNNISDFTGEKGAVIYGKEKGKKNRVYTDTTEQLIVLVDSKPIIEAKDYIYIQNKLEANKKVNTAKKSSKYTWLTGITVCAKCNHSIGVKNTRGYYYMMCSRARLYNACENNKMYKMQELEEIIYEQVKKYLRKIDIEKITPKQNTEKEKNEINSLQLKKAELSGQIEALVNAIAKGTKISTTLEKKVLEIEDNINDLDLKIRQLENYILDNKHNIDVNVYKKSIDIFLNNFPKLSIEEKSQLVKIFVSKIYINKDEIKIIYNV